MKTISLIAIMAFLFVGCEKRADQQDNTTYYNDSVTTEDAYDMNSTVDTINTDMDMRTNQNMDNTDMNQSDGTSNTGNTNNIDTINTNR